MHSRIEQIAAQQLQMQVPDAKRIQIVSLAKTPVQQPAFNKNESEVR